MVDKQSLLHTDNKYVKKNSLKLDKKYVWKLRFNRLISIVFFFIIIAIGVLGILYMNNTKVMINEKTYEYTKTKEIYVNDNILYTEEVKTPIDSILLQLGQKNVAVGKVLTLPYGLTLINGEQTVLDKDIYVVECVFGSCEKGTQKIIKENYIYGKMNE